MLEEGKPQAFALARHSNANIKNEEYKIKRVKFTDGSVVDLQSL
jgi:hypothetical protein